MGTFLTKIQAHLMHLMRFPPDHHSVCIRYRHVESRVGGPTVPAVPFLRPGARHPYVAVPLSSLVRSKPAPVSAVSLYAFHGGSTLCQVRHVGAPGDVAMSFVLLQRKASL